MKNINRFIFAFFCLILFSCSDDIQDIETITTKNGINLINPTSSFNMVLNGSRLNQVATTFVWSDTNNTATTNYTIEVALGGTNFATPIALGTTTNQFLEVTVGQLDTAAKTAGIDPLVEGVLDVRVKTASGTSQLTSIKVTPYQPDWGIIGSATPGGWDNSTSMRFNPLTDKYSISLYLTGGEFKFRLDNSWAVNYGDNGNNLSLEPGGANIAVAAGLYTIVLDVENESYTITPIVNNWGIVGSATPGSWDTDTLLDFNATTNTYSIVIQLREGEFKFRKDNNWGFNYGDNGNNLSIEDGGANIPVPSAGLYYITVNFTTLRYTITQL